MKPVQGPNSILLVPEDKEDVHRLTRVLSGEDLGGHVFNASAIRPNRPLSTIYSRVALDWLWSHASEAAQSAGIELPERTETLTTADLAVLIYYADRHFETLVGRPE